jgi:hypothetical protein
MRGKTVENPNYEANLCTYGCPKPFIVMSHAIKGFENYYDC